MTNIHKNKLIEKKKKKFHYYTKIFDEFQIFHNMFQEMFKHIKYVSSYMSIKCL
jgi:hypothetical protein